MAASSVGHELGVDEGRASFGRSASGETTGTVNVTTNVWDWGKNASEIRTAQAAQGSAEQTGLIEREQVAFDTSSELINLMRYEQSMVVAEDYVQQMNSRVDMLLKIIQSDKGRTSELVQARAKLLSALASRKQIENQQQLTRIKLHRLLGRKFWGFLSDLQQTIVLWFRHLRHWPLWISILCCCASKRRPR